MKRLLLALLLLAPLPALAQAGLPALTLTQAAGGGQTWSVSLQVLAVMTFLTLLPGVLLAMTSFTRIVIVLAILRQALGTGQTPSSQILAGLALLLTLFVMGPVLNRINGEALQPYMEEKLSLPDAALKAAAPLRQFMLAQTRESDIATFARISGREAAFESPDAVPFTLLTAAFVTSELKTAFQIGFLLFIPFVVIDLVVASVLMSLGMMMLSPMIISLPFKIMLFVLVDGWALVMGTLAGSFYQ
ncbi:MAG: flagellar type III secretion system pore protein FliP [Immundisolibacter sp.]|uniref:flagellar type III secretion system pore protein FliP n=1 Tax=Immundisolibacter sp. TaxID=1934948 RepID=UPI0019C235CF|nr:flagellar type III secretion system pore protein FliP [Immundisolibacter sp.]MBC7162959.1 flagellar type III secretion system pore protein FliP [Immundisolibacter sp.]